MVMQFFLVISVFEIFINFTNRRTILHIFLKKHTNMQKLNPETNNETSFSIGLRKPTIMKKFNFRGLNWHITSKCKCKLMGTIFFLSNCKRLVHY